MDYSEWYRRISRPFSSETARRMVDLLDRGLVLAIACAYIASLAYLGLSGDPRLLKALSVPAVTFVGVYALRSLLDEKRPYELFDIDPVLHKNTVGKSFPSLHLASAIVIACELAWLDPLWGAPAFAACALVAFTRIVGGVHFPRDIIASALIAFACGCVGFMLIP